MSSESEAERLHLEGLDEATEHERLEEFMSDSVPAPTLTDGERAQLRDVDTWDELDSAVESILTVRLAGAEARVAQELRLQQPKEATP